MNDRNPGSPVAHDDGCICPKEENNYGSGVNGSQQKFLMDARCPIHGRATLERNHSVATADGDTESPVERDVEEL